MNTLRTTNLIVALLGCGLWYVFLLRYKHYWRYTIAPLTYLLHVVVYYGSRPWLWMEPTQINIWSTAVRMHSLIIVAGLALIFLADMKLRSRSG